MWTIEPAVAIICACLPVLRPLLAGLLDKKSSAGESNYLGAYLERSGWINIDRTVNSGHNDPNNATELRSSNKDVQVRVEDKV